MNYEDVGYMCNRLELVLRLICPFLVLIAMTSFHMMVSSDIKVRFSYNTPKPKPSSDGLSTEERLQEDLDALEALIMQAAELVEQDTSMFGTTNHSESSVSQVTFTRLISLLLFLLLNEFLFGVGVSYIYFD
jgi:hypothetical protein